MQWNSGYIGDHMELRHFLAGSTILYAITVYLFGAGQSWGIRNIWYYYVIMGLQVGAVRGTSRIWRRLSVPGLYEWVAGVVAGFGAWVGPSSRGLVMGFWQSNAFVGNIIGRQLAGDFLEYGWGNSFILLSLILGLLIEDIRHFKQNIFFNSSLQFRNSSFYTTKVRNSHLALIPDAGITF